MKMTPAAPLAPRPTRPAPRAPETNPVLAQALFSLWSGDPVVLVKSPPGAGKTLLITKLANTLHGRAGRRVAIAAQTKAQAYDVANRTAALGAPVLMLDGTDAPRPGALHPDVQHGSRSALIAHTGVVVATSARWQWVDTNAFHADVLFVDEAYQMTLADLSGLTPLADQFALVGDPGQISPVVTADIRRWAHQPAGPHVPAPKAIEHLYPHDTTRLQLPQSWRLGAATTDLIQALYEIPFTSARPPRHLSVGAQRLPEFCATPVTANDPTDSTLALTAATRARDLLTASVVTPAGSLALSPSDLAVIAPHVDQAALIAAALVDLPEVFVGTINQAQGLEREAVVAIHPLAGHRDLTPTSLDTGRLCVALSRHRSHLTVVTDTQTPAALMKALTTSPSSTAALAHQQVLDRLLIGA